MNLRAGEKTPTSEKIKQSAIVGVSLFAACFLGAAVIGVGAASNTLVIGAFAIFAIGGIACLILDLPVITLTRFVFVASFFFKAEINFFKIDDMEDPSGLNISLTLLTALVLLAYDLLTEKNREKVFSTPFSVLTAALFICAAISVINNGSTLLGWFSLWSFATSLLIAYVVASHFSRRERLEQLVITVAAGLLFTGIVAILQYSFDVLMDLDFLGSSTEEEMLGTQSHTLSRVPAFMRTPTEMAWVVSALIPLILAPVVSRINDFSARQKMFLSLAALSGTAAVILSLARGSWISLLAAMSVLVLFGWLRLSKSERKNYFVSTAGAIVLFSVLLLPLGDRIYNRLTEDDRGSSLIRIPLMENAARMIEDNPLAGVGMNGYRANMTKYDETGIFVSQIFPNPVHNIFAHITAEIGIPGGIIFCLLILAVLYECLKTMATRDRLLFAIGLGIAAGLIAFVISGVKEPGSLGSVRPPMRTFFLLAGTIFALSRIRRRLIF